MGYGSESVLGGAVRDQLVTVPLQTPADKVVYSILNPMTVHRVCALVTLAPTAVAAVLTVDRLNAPGATGGNRTVLTTMTIPIATAIGKVVYKDIEPTDVDMGDQVVVALATASTAGAAVLSVLMIPRAETAVNQADAVKSA